MGQLPPLRDGDAVLRSLAEADLPLTLAWRNHEASRRWFHSDAEIAWDGHLAWFQRNRDRTDDLVFILDIDDVPAAQVSLYDIEGGSAEFGRLLVDPARRGQGTGTRATQLCLRMADEVLGLRDLRLEVKAENEPAIRIYRELGFREADDQAPPAGSVFMRRHRAAD